MQKCLKNVILTSLVSLGAVLLISLPAYAEPQIKAAAAVLIDAATGDVLYGKDEYELLPPASTTKVLTSCLALSVADLDKVCTVSEEADKVGEATIYLSKGEQLSLKELLSAALIQSANDACFTIAENIAGSEPLFVQMMNVKARAVGAGIIHAANTNGLPDEKHLLTAYSLAKISREAMQYSLFSELVKTQKMNITGGRITRTLKTTNKLLKMNHDVIGIKTGTTDAAGACLVSAMQRDGRTVISVVLNSPDRYGESQKLLNHGVDNFENICYAEDGEIAAVLDVQYGKQDTVGAVVSGYGCVTLPKGDHSGSYSEFIPKGNIVAPVRKGEILGYMVLRNNDGKIIDQISVIAEENIAKKQGFPLLLEKIYSKINTIKTGV